MKSLLDILLLPERVYKSLNEKKLTLYIGIIFIGVVDVVYPQITALFPELFISRQAIVVFANILISIGIILLVGFIDVIFFAIPLLDLLNKVFQKEKDQKRVSIIRLIKVYIIAHIMTLPINTLLNYLFEATKLGENMAFVQFAGYLIIFVLIWFNAIIVRGINILFKVTPVLKAFVFSVVFTWNILIGVGIQYIVDNWLMKLFL